MEFKSKKKTPEGIFKLYHSRVLSAFCPVLSGQSSLTLKGTVLVEPSGIEPLTSTLPVLAPKSRKRLNLKGILTNLTALFCPLQKFAFVCCDTLGIKQAVQV